MSLKFSIVYYFKGDFMSFVHLHNHSDYSLLDGAITIDKLIGRAVELGMPAIALTDHGNMFGAIEFYQKAQKAGITPIIGQEFYMAPGSRLKKEAVKGESKSHHLLVLAKNLKGYKNLMKLSSIGYTEGFYYKPRIDMEVFEKYSEGLIVGSACLAGEIPVNILKGKIDKAREVAGRFKEILGKGNFYLELQYHGIPEQAIVNKELVKMSSDLDIPLIATNDAHYVKKEDSYAHEVLLCVQTGKTMFDEKRMRFSTDEFYLKSQQEMEKVFPDFPDAIFNTREIADMIDLELDLGHPILPNFEVPEGFNLNSYLKHLVIQGAHKIYGHNLPKEVQKRIEYELGVIISMDFSGYFLIVWDFINHAKEVGIPVGPGRGSAAGSIVAYSLGITALDPLKYDLLFERFLNPDRNEMPDMDLDFCAERREEVIDYVKDKYGHDHVSQIITFNKMKAKAVIKDVARAFDVPFAEANKISKLIDFNENLKDTLKRNSDFKKISQDEEGYGKKLIDISLKLEGLCRSAGKHAAGVVISKGPLTDYVPLYREPKEGAISSQYEKTTLEQAGLVKMDFLGLKNLTIIDKCLKLIKKSKGVDLDIAKILLDDKKTFTLLQKADTNGVFQLESGGMQNLLRRFKATTFEDIIAIVALYRPGPLNSGMTDDFVERKRDPGKIAYPHPSLEPVLKDTLGVVVYQEQVMLTSQVMGGFTLAEADKLRKAMGKKKPEIVNALEEKFLEGAKKKKIDVKLAKKVYQDLAKFAEYGFNKSHSAAYAMVTYQTAYLKAHYPVEYMSAILTAQKEQEDIVKYVNDCRANKIEILPPSVNDSFLEFTIEDTAIRFGLAAIKGVGSKAIDSIVEARESFGRFETLDDFFENVSPAVLNKGVLESLIKCGAFDEIYTNRAQLFASIENLVDAAKRLKKDRESGQGDLFATGEESQGISDELLNIPEWHDNVRLVNEKSVLGFYLSGHPLGKYEKEIKAFSSVSINQLSKKENEDEVTIVGLMNNLAIKVAQKSGKRYATAIFEDLYGTIDILIFSRTIAKYESLLLSGQPVVIKGKLEIEDEIPKKIIVNEVVSLKDFRRDSITAVHIQLDSKFVNNTLLDSLKDVVEIHKGRCPIFFHINEKNSEKIIKAHNTFNITPSESFIENIGKVVDQNAIRYSIGYEL